MRERERERESERWGGSSHNNCWQAEGILCQIQNQLAKTNEITVPNQQYNTRPKNRLTINLYRRTSTPLASQRHLYSPNPGDGIKMFCPGSHNTSIHMLTAPEQAFVNITSCEMRERE